MNNVPWQSPANDGFIFPNNTVNANGTTSMNQPSSYFTPLGYQLSSSVTSQPSLQMNPYTYMQSMLSANPSLASTIYSQFFSTNNAQSTVQQAPPTPQVFNPTPQVGQLPNDQKLLVNTLLVARMTGKTDREAIQDNLHMVRWILGTLCQSYYILCC